MGDGSYIPTIPAILLAKRILQEEIVETGAIPCMQLISLESYLAELKKLDIHIFSEVSTKILILFALEFLTELSLNSQSSCSLKKGVVSFSRCFVKNPIAK